MYTCNKGRFIRFIHEHFGVCAAAPYLLSLVREATPMTKPNSITPSTTASTSSTCSITVLDLQQFLHPPLSTVPNWLSVRLSKNLVWSSECCTKIIYTFQYYQHKIPSFFHYLRRKIVRSKIPIMFDSLRKKEELHDIAIRIFYKYHNYWLASFQRVFNVSLPAACQEVRAVTHFHGHHECVDCYQLALINLSQALMGFSFPFSYYLINTSIKNNFTLTTCTYVYLTQLTIIK